MTIRTLNLFLLILLVTTVNAEDPASRSVSISTKHTDNEHYQVHYSSKLYPITINTMHSWIIHVDDQTGVPLNNVDVTVDGGMPEHNHGLPTHPRITQNLGDGNYLLEGVRFHMGGWWQITITIQEKSKSDSVTFDLQL